MFDLYLGTFFAYMQAKHTPPWTFLTRLGPDIGLGLQETWALNWLKSKYFKLDIAVNEGSARIAWQNAQIAALTSGCLTDFILHFKKICILASSCHNPLVHPIWNNW